jgi:hypothetical protein
VDGIDKGDTVDVAVSPLNRKRVTIMPSPKATGQDLDPDGPDMAALNELLDRKLHVDPTGGAAPRIVVPSTFASTVQPVGSVQPVQPVQPAQTPDEARISELERLGQMHAQGVLTDEEFASEKARVLGQP